MRKLAIIGLAFAAGTAAAKYLLPLALQPWAAAILCLAGALCALLPGRGGRRRRAALLLLLSMAVGLLYFWAYQSLINRAVSRLETEESVVSVRVSGYGERSGSRWRVQVELEGADTVFSRAMLYGDEEEIAPLEPGDRVSGAMTVRSAAFSGETPISSFTAKGIWLMVFPRGELTVEKGTSALRTLPQRLGRAMGDLADRLFGDVAPFLKALLLGDVDDLDPADEAYLSEAGIYHVTSVSGLHCSFLLSLVAFLVGRHRRRLLAAAAIPLLILYTVMVGCPASMVRAALMLSLVLLGPLLGRESDPLTSLSFALLVLLLVNPLAIAGVGLQLSFAAMAGLLLAAPRIYERMPKSRFALVRGVWYTLAASLGCMVFTAPLTAIYFNNLSLLSPLVNVLTLWAASATFVTGLLSVLLGAVCLPAAQLLAVIPCLGARYILAVSAFVTRLPFHAVYFTNPYLVYWLVYAFASFGYCALTPRGQRKYAMAGLLSLLTLVWVVWLPISQRQGRLHAAAVDVGQGASAILASAGEVTVVDCGSGNGFLDAGDILADTLHTWGYYRVDRLVLTHYHDDHANGLPTLLARVEVGEVLAPRPGEVDGSLHAQVAALCGRYGIPLRYVEAEERLSLGQGELTVYPPVGGGATNEEGLSLLCSAGRFDLLITGDMNRANEKRLLAAAELPDLEVLLAGHHGSAGATGRELLDALTPEAAVISVGTNSYGHPSEEAMQRMVKAGLRVYRTDLQGSISILVH